MPRGPKGNGQTRRVSSTNSPRAGPLLVTSMRRRDHARRVFLAVSWVTDLGCHRVKKGVRTWRQVLPGHWEGDLLSGPNNSYIATLVERHTRYVMLAKVAGKDTQTVVSALIKQAKKLPKELYNPS